MGQKEERRNRSGKTLLCHGKWPQRALWSPRHLGKVSCSLGVSTIISENTQPHTLLGKHSPGRQGQSCLRDCEGVLPAYPHCIVCRSSWPLPLQASTQLHTFLKVLSYLQPVTVNLMRAPAALVLS